METESTGQDSASTADLENNEIFDSDEDGSATDKGPDDNEGLVPLYRLLPKEQDRVRILSSLRKASREARAEYETEIEGHPPPDGGPSLPRPEPAGPGGTQDPPAIRPLSSKTLSSAHHAAVTSIPNNGRTHTRGAALGVTGAGEELHAPATRGRMDTAGCPRIWTAGTDGAACSDHRTKEPP